MASLVDKNKGKPGPRNYYVVSRNKWHRVGPDRRLAKAAKTRLDAEELSTPFGLHRASRAPEFNAAADAWLEARKKPDLNGHPRRRSWGDDQSRLKHHLRPRFGGRTLDQITEDDVRALVLALRGAKAAQTIRNVLHTLSRLFEDQPKMMGLKNPVRMLSRSDREDIGPGWDPKKTPFLKSKDDIRKLYLSFAPMSADQPFRAMYAVGALAGPRPGEVRAMEWTDFDSGWENLHIQRSSGGPLKDDESRVIPVPPSLAAIMREWRVHVPVGEKRCFPPSARGSRRGGARYVKDKTMNDRHTEALLAAGMPEEWTVYSTTRHSFAAQWVINGGSLLKLSAILGHSSTVVTQRYAHLVPGTFTEAERSLVDVDMREGQIIGLSGNLSCGLAGASKGMAETRNT